MLTYGKNLSVARVVNYLGRNVDSVTIGYFRGAGVLGLYQKAYQWSLTPFWQMYLPLMPVAVSSFSRLQDDVPRYRYYARTTLLALFSVTLPATMLLLLDAHHVVLLLLGRKWMDAIPFFRILAVGAYFSGFASAMNWLYLAEGRTAQQLRWAMVSTPIMIVSVLIGVRMGGARGVAIAFSGATVLLSFPAIWYCLRGSPLGAGDFLGSVWRPAIASLAAGGALYFIRGLLPHTSRPIIHLSIDATIYAAVYLIFWLALPGGLEQSARVRRHLRLLLPAASDD